MRKLLSCLFILVVSLSLNAQNLPTGFNYQAVVRDAAGYPKKGENVNLRFSFYPGEFSNTAEYIETHQVRTDSLGIVTLSIGSGSKTGGTVDSFSDIRFDSVAFWMEVEINDAGNWISLSKQQLLSVPYARVASRVAYDMPLVPVGTILPFAGTIDKIPDGWLLCDGSMVSRSDYNVLFSTIGTNWGRGDGVTTFHLPDFRGLFLRGVDKGTQPGGGVTGRDPDRDGRFPIADGGNAGNEVGSAQWDMFGRHSHGYYDLFNPWDTSADDAKQRAAQINEHREDRRTSDEGGNETRPRNAYVYYIVKY